VRQLAQFGFAAWLTGCTLIVSLDGLSGGSAGEELDAATGGSNGGATSIEDAEVDAVDAMDSEVDAQDAGPPPFCDT